MTKAKKSGAAIFMYVVIAVSAILAAICMTLYYTYTVPTNAMLWVGIVSFMIMYHLWLRIIMGSVSKLFNISYKCSFFSQLPFEKKLYRLLRVKKWKNKTLTYNPELFNIKNNSFEDIANTMAKAETDHWINEAISLSAILFSLLWGQVWVFALTSFAAMLFDAQFIIIQRYNRPRILSIIEKKQKNTHKELV